MEITNNLCVPSTVFLYCAQTGPLDCMDRKEHASEKTCAATRATKHSRHEFSTSCCSNSNFKLSKPLPLRLSLPCERVLRMAPFGVGTHETTADATPAHQASSV